MSRYACIHGHFYQPPRENAWLEAVETQESAYPDHDWNERITRECYAPNAKARLLDDQGKIIRLVNNYARASFNFGPTLLAWMKEGMPQTYAAIIQSDAAARERFGGHGSALAQGYNHAILPLCNDRDRRTQVLWGIRDFAARFGRSPEGMWLPETAADTPTLEVLAELGIAFTILAPRQCAAVRPIDAPHWEEVNGSPDPTRPYLCKLPSGRTIVLFFYDGPVSQGVAFEGLLNSGERFSSRITGLFSDDRAHPQLVHIATDGESYGHHHRHGEMALADALERIDRDPGVELINYGLYLERHPPTMEARIHENSSWSCVHGVERWRSDCGCNSGRQGCHQRWRGPLREAFDWLRDSVAPEFARRGEELFKDPWAARDAYVAVILDRSPDSLDRFFAEHVHRPLSEPGVSTALSLMELQRHAMLMYTSCAWFFDDVAGIETVQVIQYAARVAQIAKATLGLDLEPELLERLARAQGTTHQMPDGRAVYEKAVRPAMLDLPRVGAHYALSRMFNGGQNRVYAYDVREPTERRRSAGRSRLLVGHCTLRSRVTLESNDLSYAVLHLGDHTASCGVRTFRNEESWSTMAQSAEAAFDRADFAEVIRVLDREFGSTSYSIASLFRDEQHAVVRKILDPTLAQIDGSYRQIYEQHAPLARFLRSLGLHVPRRIQIVASFVVSQSIRASLAEATPDLARALELIQEAAAGGIELDEPTIAHAVSRSLRSAAGATADQLRDPAILASIASLARFVVDLPFNVDLWPLQEAFIERASPLRAELQPRAEGGDEAARAWLGRFNDLADCLRVVA